MKNIFIITVLMTFQLTGCSSADKEIVVLKNYDNMKYSEMVKELGPPGDKTGYTIKNAPTKAWNHAELFAIYPKIPENENVQIMEAAWDRGDYVILACYHVINGENRCLVAKKILKQVKF